MINYIVSHFEEKSISSIQFNGECVYQFKKFIKVSIFISGRVASKVYTIRSRYKGSWGLSTNNFCHA